MDRTICALAALAVALVLGSVATASPTYRVERVIDGDTVRLRNGASVRLVQIDTPEVFFGTECYGRCATAKRLLPVGTRVRLPPEPATDQVGQRNLSVTADTYTHVLTDYRELDRLKLLKRARTRQTYGHTSDVENHSVAGTF